MLCYHFRNGLGRSEREGRNRKISKNIRAFSQKYTESVATTMKDLAFLPYLYANYMTFHYFVDFDRTYKAPGSETKDFIFSYQNL